MMEPALSGSGAAAVAPLQEAKEYFASIDTHRKEFVWEGECTASRPHCPCGVNELLHVAFGPRPHAAPFCQQSCPATAGPCMNHLRSHTPVTTTGDEDGSALEMAFSKKKVEERKEWLKGFQPGTYLDQSVDAISYSDFVHKARVWAEAGGWGA